MTWHTILAATGSLALRKAAMHDNTADVMHEFLGFFWRQEVPLRLS
jgi:hypothetical protein